LRRLILLITQFKKESEELSSAKKISPMIAKYKSIKEDADKLKPFVENVVEEIKKNHEKNVKQAINPDPLLQAKETLAFGWESLEQLFFGIVAHLSNLKDYRAVKEIGVVVLLVQKKVDSNT